MQSLNGRVATLEKAIPPTFHEMVRFAFSLFGWPDETTIYDWCNEYREDVWNVWDRRYGRATWLPVLKEFKRIHEQP